MIIVKILGLLDIITAAIFWLSGLFALIPQHFVLLFSFFLFVKGIFFLMSKDIASIFDIICAVLIYSSLSFAMPKFIIILVTLFLLQKGVFSLIA